MVAFNHEPNGEDRESASKSHPEDFSKKTSPGPGMFRVLSGEILHVLNEVARNGALLGAAQGGMGAFTSPKVSPLKKFVKHKLPTDQFIVTKGSGKAKPILSVIWNSLGA